MIGQCSKIWICVYFWKYSFKIRLKEEKSHERILQFCQSTFVYNSQCIVHESAGQQRRQCKYPVVMVLISLQKSTKCLKFEMATTTRLDIPSHELFGKKDWFQRAKRTHEFKFLESYLIGLRLFFSVFFGIFLCKVKNSVFVLAEDEVEISSRGRFQKHIRQLNLVCFQNVNIYILQKYTRFYSLKCFQKPTRQSNQVCFRTTIITFLLIWLY